MAELTDRGGRIEDAVDEENPERAGVPDAGSGRIGSGRIGHGRIGTGLRAYGMITRMWVRSTLAYPASFALMVGAGFAITSLDFVVVLLMFSHVDRLGGYGLGEIALLYGLASTAFGLCQLFLGSMQKLGARVRDGSFDALLVRPVPVLVQVAADRFSLQRVGRPLQGLCVLGYALVTLDTHWTFAKVLMLPFAVLSGAGIFAAVYVAGAAFQFVAQDGAEVESAFTYGGATMLEYPPTLFGQDVLRAVTFVLPLAFVNWIPAAYVLDRPLPLDLPGWCVLLPPLVAVAALALAGLAWRAALRSYRSTGS